MRLERGVPPHQDSCLPLALPSLFLVSQEHRPCSHALCNPCSVGPGLQGALDTPPCSVCTWKGSCEPPALISEALLAMSEVSVACWKSEGAFPSSLQPGAAGWAWGFPTQAQHPEQLVLCCHMGQLLLCSMPCDGDTCRGALTLIWFTRSSTSAGVGGQNTPRRGLCWRRSSKGAPHVAAPQLVRTGLVSL